MKKSRVFSALVSAVLMINILPFYSIAQSNENEYIWDSFRGDVTNNCVTSVPAPKNADETVLYWAAKKGEGTDSDAMGSPIIVGENLVFCSGDKLYKMNRFTGEISSQQGDMAAKSSFNIVSPLYADGKIFVGLAGGIVQAFDAQTLESLWIYHDPLGGQPNSQLSYKNGYVYAAFWNAESDEQANLVCISVEDEDSENPIDEKNAVWTYTQTAGFYWTGAYVSDSFLIIGTDDGKNGSDSDSASLLSIDPTTGAVIDRIDSLHGDIRSSVAYDKVTNRYYFTSKGGRFYSAAVNEDGTFRRDENGISGYDLKEISLGNMINGRASMSTSTPVVYNGRAYIGVSGKSQFSEYSGHYIAVIDLESWQIAYCVPTKGYPQTSGLLTNAYEDEDGYAYIYFIDNYTPGQVRVIKDKPGVTSVVDGVTETYMNKGKYVQVNNCAPVLFTPEGAQAQFAICSPIADEYGTLYFKNDSAFMMAVGSKIENIEVTKQPDKTLYKEGDTFDPTGMQVVAHLANGMEREITNDISISDKSLTSKDKDVTIEYDRVMYGDKLDSENGNQVGVKADKPETYVDITVLEEDAANKLFDVIDKIDAIGEVTLESEQAIADARQAYDGLDDELKNMVYNYDVLVGAEAKLAQLKSESSEVESSSLLDSSDLDSSKSDSESSADVSGKPSGTSSAVIQKISTSSDSDRRADSAKGSDTVKDNSGSPNTGSTQRNLFAVMIILGTAVLAALIITDNRRKGSEK